MKIEEECRFFRLSQTNLIVKYEYMYAFLFSPIYGYIRIHDRHDFRKISQNNEIRNAYKETP